MTKRMLIDATQHEETRVAVIDNNRLEEFDYESTMRKPLKGNIFLAKVTRVEPSLQACFVSYGGNRHGFLPFSEIHPDYFRIPVADQEEFELMQREQLEEHDKLEAEEEGSDGEETEVTESSEDEDDISDAKENSDDDADVEADEDSEALDTDANTDTRTDQDGSEEAGLEQADIEASDDDAAQDEDTEEDSGEASEDNDDKRRNRRGGRGRYGRGRGRGGKRSNFRSRRPENFGNDEAGQAQRFRFNLRRKYKIQEVIKRGQIMLIQVAREERGNKGAAVTSYLSLPGRYCVLMPNSPRGGGVSRKISNQKDRSKMKDLLGALEVPAGMSTILRTAGVTRTKVEVKRDLDYLMRLWNSIRELTLQSTAPAMVYEEADLLQRSVRDHYSREIEEILVAGDQGHKTVKNFMKMLMPSHAKRVKLYDDQDISLFHRYQVESQIADIGETEVTLPSGGYLVINPTEALVSVDVNSGRSTKERNIENTALRTNLEAAEEVARQLRLRDLGGLVVIDFIDMEDRRNNGKVERKMRDALSGDRARVQVGRISSFGLMELSRQRLNASLSEAQFEVCPHCEGRGRVRTADSASLLTLRAIEAEGVRKRAAQVIAHVPANVALYLLNYKRTHLSEIEARHGLEILIRVDEDLPASAHRVEVSKPLKSDDEEAEKSDDSAQDASQGHDDENSDGDGEKKKRSRGRRGGRNRRNKDRQGDDQTDTRADNAKNTDTDANIDTDTDTDTGTTPAPVTKAEADTAVSHSEGENDSDETPKKPKRTRRRKKKADDADTTASDSAEVEASAKEEADEAPKDKPKKRGRPKKIKIEDSANDSEDSAASAPAPEATDAPSPTEAESNPHEIVNEAPKKKRRGWWSRK